MVINGRPDARLPHADQELGRDITLAPLPVFELIADLSVNTGKWMRGMSERLETWLHMREDEVGPAPARRAHGPRARGEDLRARSLHRVRLLRRGLRHRAHARGLRRRGRARTRSRASASIRATSAATRSSTSSSATTTACSAACRCSPATTSARSNCRCRRRSRSFAGRWCDRASSSRAGLGRVKTSHRRTRLRARRPHFAKPSKNAVPSSNQRPQSDFPMGNRVSSSAASSIVCCKPSSSDDSSSTRST